MDMGTACRHTDIEYACPYIDSVIENIDALLEVARTSEDDFNSQARADEAKDWMEKIRSIAETLRKELKEEKDKNYKLEEILEVLKEESCV